MKHTTLATAITAIIVTFIVTFVHLASQVALYAGLIDDTYIFLRYARNFAAGEGLVFNAGERVEGYSSLLWVLWLSLMGLLQWDLVLLSKWTSAVLGLATVLLVVLFTHRRLSSARAPLALVTAWFLVTNLSFEYWTWSGMDTSLFTFLFFLTFAVFLQQVKEPGTMGWAGICFMLAALARLDMLAVAPIYLTFIYLFNRKHKDELLRKYASFLVPQGLLILSFLWRYAYYGSLLPNTYHAKVGVPQSNLLSAGFGYTAGFAQAYGLLFLVLVVAIILLVWLRAGFPLDLPLSFSLVGSWMLYVTYIGGDHFASFRFFVPVLPVLAFLVVSIFDHLAGKVRATGGWRLAAISAVIVILLTLTNYYAYEFNHEGLRARATVTLTERWAAVGQWLKKNAPEDATIASVVVGAIPYYSELRTYDLLGLTDKHIATEGRVSTEAEPGHQKYDTDYILSKKPDFIIYNSSGQYTNPIYEDPDVIGTRYAYALYDLARDERTRHLYEYKAVKMENERYIELLQLKGSKAVTEFNERLNDLPSR